MMEGLHDIILIIIIGAIILFQLIVFRNNYRKIQDYKKTIEKARNFKIVEVAVPEDMVKEIEVDEILRNPEAFQNDFSKVSSSIIGAAEVDSLLESESEEIGYAGADLEEFEISDAAEDEEEYESDFEYEEPKNNKR
ncbi:hypothetical protein ACW6QP_04280 [Salegentibacter sp. HM20]